MPWDKIYEMVDGQIGGVVTCFKDKSLGEVNFNNSTTCAFDTSVNIEATENNKCVKMFPTPCNQHLFLMLPNERGSYTISISNIAGKSVFEESNLIADEVITLNTASWNNGMYFIRIQNDLETKILKVIVNHDN